MSLIVPCNSYSAWGVAVRIELEFVYDSCTVYTVWGNMVNCIIIMVPLGSSTNTRQISTCTQSHGDGLCMFNFTFVPDVGMSLDPYTLFECFLVWPSLHPFTLFGYYLLVLICFASNMLPYTVRRSKLKRLWCTYYVCMPTREAMYRVHNVLIINVSLVDC